MYGEVREEEEEDENEGVEADEDVKLTANVSQGTKYLNIAFVLQDE